VNRIASKQKKALSNVKYDKKKRIVGVTDQIIQKLCFSHTLVKFALWVSL